MALRSQLNTHRSKDCAGGVESPSMSLHDLSNLLRKKVMDLKRHTSSDACVVLGEVVLFCCFNQRLDGGLTVLFQMVVSPGRSKVSSSSESDSDPESDEEEGGVSPYFSADIKERRSSTLSMV